MKNKHLLMLLISIISISLTFSLFNCEEDTETEPSEETTTTTTTLSDALVDITNSDYTSKNMLVLNVNGDTQGDAESIGSVPSTSKKKILRKTSLQVVKNTKSLIKDVHLPMPAVNLSRRVVAKPSKGLTHNDTTATFNAWDNQYAKQEINTTLRYGTADSKCLIYVKDGEEGTHDWPAVGQYFDTEVYPKDTAAFGTPTDVDTNSKVIILYYRMPNDWSDVAGGGYDSSTLGYFYPIDLYDTSTYADSNECEVFYMNIEWGAPDNSEMMRTLAHEFQHMINYGHRVIVNSKGRMDTWLDEALAESAEHVVTGTAGMGRINYFNSDSNDYLKNGHPLCYWFTDDSSEANYALSYTFLQYCRLQSSNGTDIYKQLLENEYADYQSIEAIMKNENSEFEDFATLHYSYRLANLMHNTTGIYGYKDEQSVFDLTIAAPTTIPTQLMPGGAIYLNPSETELSSFAPSGNQGDNIRYVRVNSQ